MVSVPSSQRHGTWRPCRWTPPIHRSMPLRAIWSASPASTRAPVSVRARPVASWTGGRAGRPGAAGAARPPAGPSGESTWCRPCRAVSPLPGADEGCPSVGRAVGDGGHHPPLGQRQAVPGCRVLSAEPVERLAQEPQLAQPRGRDGGQADRRGRPQGRPRAGGQLKGCRGQPRARAGVRQLEQLPAVSSPRPPKRAMPGCSPMQIKVMRVAGTPRAARRARISVTCSWSYRSASNHSTYSPSRPA